MKRYYTIVALSAMLTACGGGGGGSPAPSSTSNADITKHAVNGAQAAADAIPAVPSSTSAFAGGFVSIDNQPAGYLAGDSPRHLAEQIGAFVVADPVKWAVPYRLMLSDSGLRVSVAGKRIGTGAVSGLPIYAADDVFSVRLTTNGVVVTQMP